MTQVLLLLEHEREQKMAEIVGLDREQEDTFARIERRRVTLRAEIGQLSQTVESLKAMSDGVEGESGYQVQPPPYTTGFKPLEIETSTVPKPATDSGQNVLLDYILAVEAELAPTRFRRGLSPKEISIEIERAFGRVLDFHKINGRVWYLYRRNRIAKNDRYYFLPDTVIPTTPGGPSSEADA